MAAVFLAFGVFGGGFDALRGNRGVDFGSRRHFKAVSGAVLSINVFGWLFGLGVAVLGFCGA